VKKNVFFIGIGGTGLSAIARVLKEKGYSVSGSDQYISDPAKDLISFGIPVYEGHSADHLVGVDLVVRSSAISEDNPEIQEARRAKIPVYKREDILADLMKDKVGIGIAGTHGKTTTTAMLATALAGLQLDPSYIIGSVSKNLGNNAHFGMGDHFVIEADEYDRMFLGLALTYSIITNLEHDHPDCYPTFSDYLLAFKAFSENLRPGGKLICCRDDFGVQRLLQLLNAENILTYGISEDCDYQARNFRMNTVGGYSFNAIKTSGDGIEVLTEVELKIPGLHNVLNSLSIIALTHQLGLDVEKSATLLGDFSGTSRRFEIVAEINQITLIDDYAHHPTEIQATLQAAKSRYPNRAIWAVWQPHTYSRTQILFNEFVNSFTDADHVIISQIYASREKNDNFSASQLVEAMSHSDTRYIAHLEDIEEYLFSNLKPGAVLLVFSAGDAIQINKNLKLRLAQKEKNHEL
jgi:UDP-N-acetylmuramate--alanine ligase